MGADPFTNITPADERVIAQARKRGPAAFEKVVRAIAKRAIVTAHAKDAKREYELIDDTDRSGFTTFLTRPLRRRGGTGEE